MFNRIKKYFAKPEEVGAPKYAFIEFERKPIEVQIKGVCVGRIGYRADLNLWFFSDTDNYAYTFQDLLKIAFKLNSLNN